MPEAQKRIVVEYRDKGRKPGRSEFMAEPGGLKEFDRVADVLEQSGSDGDRLIRVGKTVLVRAREVHNTFLEGPAVLSVPMTRAPEVPPIFRRDF